MASPMGDACADEGDPISPQRQVDWTVVVGQICAGDPRGEEILYRNLVAGARCFLQRRLGKHEVDDQVHDLFLTIVETIRRGELREPERLMGFVRTILYRRLNAEIARIMQGRETSASIDSTIARPAPESNPEQAALNRERVTLMQKLLGTMNRRDFEILNRYYLREEPEGLICADMGLSPSRFRVLKSRAKARITRLMQRTLARRVPNRE